MFQVFDACGFFLLVAGVAWQDVLGGMLENCSTNGRSRGQFGL